MSVRLSRQSLEYLTFPLAISPVDPMTLSHEVAIIDELAQPQSTDWFGVNFIVDRVYVLVRASLDADPGGDITLTVGRWRVWWRALSNPEYPVRQVGVVQVV